jgi:hypothetical protein
MTINLIAELRLISSWNSFAASLVNQYDAGRALSDRQLSAARGMLDKMAVNAKSKHAAAQAASVVDLSRVHEMFAVVLGNGAKRPNFRFGDLRLGYWDVMPDAVFVKKDGEKVGRIEGGKYLPKNVSPDTARAIADKLHECAADPLAAAVRYGRDTGECACCGKLLVNDKVPDADGLTSVQRGVGPVCARKWGLI